MWIVRNARSFAARKPTDMHKSQKSLFPIYMNCLSIEMWKSSRKAFDSSLHRKKSGKQAHREREREMEWQKWDVKESWQYANNEISHCKCVCVGKLWVMWIQQNKHDVSWPYFQWNPNNSLSLLVNSVGIFSTVMMLWLLFSVLLLLFAFFFFFLLLPLPACIA